MANKSYEWNEEENKYWGKRIEQHSGKDPESPIYKELLQFNKNNPIEKRVPKAQAYKHIKICSSSPIVFKLSNEATWSIISPPIRLVIILCRASKEWENRHPTLKLLVEAKIERDFRE